MGKHRSIIRDTIKRGKAKNLLLSHRPAAFRMNCMPYLEVTPHHPMDTVEETKTKTPAVNSEEAEVEERDTVRDSNNATSQDLFESQQETSYYLVDEPDDEGKGSLGKYVHAFFFTMFYLLFLPLSFPFPISFPRSHLKMALGPSSSL